MPIKPSMKMLPFALVGLGTTVIVLLAVLFLLQAWWSNPIPVLGFGDAPDQPIAFPHTTHVADAGIQCEFCHRNVAQGDAASVPAVEQCLFCHQTIVGTSNLEIAKLLEYGGLDPTGQEDPLIEPQPIEWARVHRLPDTVQFAHEPHIRFFSLGQGMETAQVCAICHGDVAQMEQVEQVRSLKMGDCVNCHQDNDAPTDCTTCHY